MHSLSPLHFFLKLFFYFFLVALIFCFFHSPISFKICFFLLLFLIYMYYLFIEAICHNFGWNYYYYLVYCESKFVPKSLSFVLLYYLLIKNKKITIYHQCFIKNRNLSLYNNILICFFIVFVSSWLYLIFFYYYKRDLLDLILLSLSLIRTLI